MAAEVTEKPKPKKARKPKKKPPADDRTSFTCARCGAHVPLDADRCPSCGYR